MFLQKPADIFLPPNTQCLIKSLNLELADDDCMYAGNDRHYLSCGASALNTIFAALSLSQQYTPGSILDFGAGAGRVTRWLRAAFPDIAIDCCDLRTEDMTFCEKAFAVKTWISGVEIADLSARSTYDLIWIGSVMTHLPANSTTQLLDKVLSWCNHGGLVVTSLHGRSALRRHEDGRLKYIEDSKWKEIKNGYLSTGYGFSNYAEKQDYGISTTKLSWVTSLIESRSDIKLVLLSEEAWDGHHDVLAIQKMGRKP
uniref:Methyltransferase domain-containing protein n=1 Tax=Candidatus Kentrum sp. FW TaxID=2126338 RepID=A0A450TJZ1_9GAMM|nr:MAG: Methyltransferase domain-containing protein [Candidatus Kentron sp. FW]